MLRKICRPGVADNQVKPVYQQLAQRKCLVGLPDRL